jgi:hypothetical protein
VTFAFALLEFSDHFTYQPISQQNHDHSLDESAGTCNCRFARCYWLLCRHVIYAYSYLGLIDEPDWPGFEVYSTRELIIVKRFVT